MTKKPCYKILKYILYKATSIEFKELRMKKTFILSAAVMMLFGASVFAKESTLIDFTMLDADISIKAQDSDVVFLEMKKKFYKTLKIKKHFIKKLLHHIKQLLRYGIFSINH